MIEQAQDFLNKARESLQGAESELVNRRYNNAANRAYYACFHAAIAALLHAGVRAESWEHKFVQGQFSGLLIWRRKLYRSDLAGLLPYVYGVRRDADYNALSVSAKEAQRAVEKATLFVRIVEATLEELK